MASTPDVPVSHGTDLEGLDEATAARSVLIHGIPAQMRDEDIVIHFQKGKNGGGEIDHVRIAGDGKALITFESREVAQRVLGCRHLFKGSKLELTPYRLISRKLPEVFERVTARVNLKAFQLSSQESRQLLKRAQQETNVAWYEACDGFIFSGTFDQVETCRQLLQRLMVRPAHPKSKLAEFEERRDEALEGSAGSRESKQNASEHCKEENNNFNHPNISTFDVHPQFMKLLKRAYEKDLQEMETKFSIQIVWYKDTTRVEIRPNQISGTEHFQDGCDAFIDLYQKVFPEMKRELIVIEDCSDDAEIEKAINAVMAENPVLIEKIDGKLSVYGQNSRMDRAIVDLKRELRMAKAGARKSRRDNRSKHERPSAPADGCDFPEHNPSSPPKVLKHELPNGVIISLYQGDITDEQVDAIVNAANECLQHGGGVAGAILAKGGRQIEEDSRQQMSRRKKLEVGDAVFTRGGNLACKYVIHAVGPRWTHHGRDRSMVLLRRACVESLRWAGRLNLCSVALPAISSGIFGMPKDLCAKVMFDAVEEYSISVDVQCSKLRDVRFVIIDAPTVGFFHEEFVKRFLSPDSLQMRSNRSEQFANEKLTTQSADTQHTSNISSFGDNKNMGSSNQGKQVAAKKVTDQTAVSHEDHQQYSSISPSVDKTENTRESDGLLKAITAKDDEESKATLSRKRNSTRQTGQTADKDKEVKSFHNVKNNDPSSTKIQDVMSNSGKEHENVAGEIRSTPRDNVADSKTAGSAKNVKINPNLSQGDGGLPHGNSDQTRNVETSKGPLLVSATASSAENVKINANLSQGDGLPHGNYDQTRNVETPKGPLLDSATASSAENVKINAKLSEGDGLPHGNSNQTRNVETPKAPLLDKTTASSAKNVKINVKLSQGDEFSHGNSDQTEKVETPNGTIFNCGTAGSAENVKINAKLSQGDGLPRSNSDQTRNVETPYGTIFNCGTASSAENAKTNGKVSQDGGLGGWLGRGRGALAVCFPSKRYGSISDESNRSGTLTVARNITTGRGRSMTARTGCSANNPPGLRVTSEGLHFANNLEEQFLKDLQNGSLLQPDREQIPANDVPRSSNDQSLLERNGPKGATPVTNVRNTEPEHSNEDRNVFDCGAVEGQKPRSIPDSVHGLSSSDPKTPTDNTATSGPTAGDKGDVPEVVHDSNTPNNASAENANTVDQYNADRSRDSSLADDGKLCQSLSFAEDDAPKHKLEETSLAVPGKIFSSEHEEKLRKYLENSCQPETYDLSNPSCDKTVEHPNTKRSIEDQPLYGGKFQKLEKNTETSHPPGSLDPSRKGDNKPSESLVASSNIEAPVKSEEKLDTPIEKMSTNEEMEGDLLQHSD